MPFPDLTPREIKDFSGGMTDLIKDGAPNQGEIVDNFLIALDGKSLKQRPGSELLDEDIPNLVKPEGPTGELINFGPDEEILIRTGGKIFVNTAGVWDELLGSTGASAFPDMSATGITCTRMWEGRGHAYIIGFDPDPDADPETNDLICYPPVKIYRTPTGEIALRSASVPRFPDGFTRESYNGLLDSAIELANAIKASLEDHFARTPAHTNAHPYTFAADATDFDSLITLIDDLYVAYNEHVFDADAAGAADPFSPQYHWDPEFLDPNDGLGNPSRVLLNFPLQSHNSPTTILECVRDLNQLRRYIHLHYDSFFSNHPLARIHYDNEDLLGFPEPAISVGEIQVPSAPVLLYPSEDDELYFDPCLFGLLEYVAQTVGNLLNAHVSSSDPWDTTNPAHPEVDGLFYTRYWGLDSAEDYDYVTGDNDPYHTALVLAYRLVFEYSRHINGSSPLAVTAHVDVGSERDNPEAQISSYTTLYESNQPVFDMYTPAGWNAFRDLLVEIYEKLWTHTENEDLHDSIAPGADWFIPDPFPLQNQLVINLLLGKSLAYKDLEFTSYLYGFVPRRQYEVSQLGDLEDIGAPLILQTPPVVALGETRRKFINDFVIGPTGNPEIYAIPIEEFPELEGSPHDDENMIIDIYRSSPGGTTLFKVGELRPGESTFYDAFPDEDLADQIPIYTAGGVVPNHPAPASVAMALVGAYAYYGGTLENLGEGEQGIYPSRLRQSLANQPGSSPEQFFTDLTSPIRLIGSAGGRVIVCCERGIYRIDGVFTEDGAGGMIPENISESAGGAGPNAGDSLDELFFFVGVDGIYYTDGFIVNRMTKHLPKRMKDVLSSPEKRRRIQAKIHPEERRLYISVTEGDSTHENSVYVVDLNHQINTGAAAVVRLHNDEHFAPTAITIFQDDLVRGDVDGYVFRHDPELTTDPEIDRNTGLLTEGAVHIPWKWRSVAENLGLQSAVKWVPEMDVFFENHGELDVQPRSINNLHEEGIADLRPIRFRNQYDGMIRATRKFSSSQGIRSVYKQVEIVPAPTTEDPDVYPTDQIAEFLGVTIWSHPVSKSQVRGRSG